MLPSFIKKNVSLHKYTTLRTGGVSTYFASVHSVDELEESFAFAKMNGLPIRVLGGGSNVLVSDDVFNGLTIKNNLTGIAYEENSSQVYARVKAGESLDFFVTEAVEKGLWGVENLALIPGTVGATPVQNVGAYGVETKDICERVRAIDMRTNKRHVFTNRECRFSYRNSFFKSEEGKHFFIYEVEYKLSKIPSPQITYTDLALRFVDKEISSPREIYDAVREVRRGKFPDWTQVGTAGSFFKNPIISYEIYESLKKRYPDLPGFDVERGIKVPLGWILDKIIKLKGYRNGNVGLYEHQALVLVNYGYQNAEEIISFSKNVRSIISETMGIVVEEEVTRLT